MKTPENNFTDHKPLRILVAEDSPLNQQVVLKQLEKLGYKADAVADGTKVIESLARKPFDVILMDCQMPEMSGYEATWQIRDREKEPDEASKKSRHTYIIAMTANSAADNREKCLAAGMDDFINKPVRLCELEAALFRAMADRAALKEVDEVIDPVIITGLRQLRTSGEPDPLPDLIDLFEHEAPTHLAAMTEAITKNDVNSLARVFGSASALKGSASNIGARNLAALCDEILQAAHLGLLSDALPVLDRAKEELDRVHVALDKIKSQSVSPKSGNTSHKR
jgi:CheY-like chemotaxis protein/HPt (histidine-containing phosphotransfer) domain-containing protein